MKKIILLSFLLQSFIAWSQPKLVGSLLYNGSKEGGGIFRLDLPATTPGITHAFDNFAPHYAQGGVVAGDANRLYGCLQFNGTENVACLYRIQQDGTGFTKIMDFNNQFFVTSRPFYHTDGKLYIALGATIKIYDPSNGSSTDIPINTTSINRSIYIDANNFIYYSGFNSLAKIATDGTQESILHTFDINTEGSNGIIAVTETPGDTLFGIQQYGGINNVGTIFSIKKDGSGFVVQHQFTSATGTIPESKLVYMDGKLYGTTTQGGTFNNGVIFCINADGSNYRVLHNFEVGVGGGTPARDIAISSNGRIFGSYAQFIYEVFNPFRMYRVDTSGANFSKFFYLDQHEGGHWNMDVLLLNDQKIFLTTQTMGRSDGGAVNTVDTGAFSGTALFNFGASALGFQSRDALIKASNDKLYGTTKFGGATGNGIVFSTELDGTGYAKLLEFTDADGYDPIGRLLEASDGKLYGCLQYGGPTNAGGIYRVDKNGANFQVIYRFADLTKGYSPTGSLVEDAGGALYGIAFYGGSSNIGTIYKINKDGSGYTVLKDFSDVNDLRYAADGLVLSNGYLYGSASNGGLAFQGGIFRIKTDGTDYSALKEYTFSAPDGGQPRGAPIVASNGKLYGTAAVGGANGGGVVFSMDITGTNYTVLRNLNNTTDGSFPSARLVQGSDGLIYGTNASGNVTPGFFGGTLFKMNLDGSGFAVLKEFNTSTEGGGPSGLVDLNGAFNLPVQWQTFTAQPKEQVVQLFWQTAQEQNTDRFIVERSGDGISYNTIGFVKAAGNASGTSSYRLTDNDPLNGNNYYRLKQVDLDGKFIYSKVVRVSFDGKPLLSLHPNPTSDNLFIRVGATEKIRSVTVTDINGRIILRAGENSRSSMTLHVQSLTNGLYWLQVETNQKKYNQSFIKN